MRLTAYSAARCGCAFTSADPRLNFSGSGEGGDPLNIEKANIGRGSDDWWSMSKAGTLYWDDNGRKMFRRLPFRIAGAASIFVITTGQLIYYLGGSGIQPQRPPRNGILLTDPEFLPYFSETNWKSGRLTLDDTVYGDDVDLVWEISSVMFAPRSAGARIHSDNTGRQMQLSWSRVEDGTFTPVFGYATNDFPLENGRTAQFELPRTSSPGGGGDPGSISKGQGFVPKTARWLQTTTNTETVMGHSYGFSYLLWADADFITHSPRSLWRMEVAGFLTAVPANPGS